MCFCSELDPDWDCSSSFLFPLTLWCPCCHMGAGDVAVSHTSGGRRAVCVCVRGECCCLCDVFLSGAVTGEVWVCPRLQHRDVTMDFVRLSIKTQLSQLSLSPLPVHFLPSLSTDRSVLCVLFIPDLFLLPQA